MKKYLLMAMAVLAALSLMVAGCGGKEEAKKAENKGGEAAKAGKASSAQAGKALPKTSAVK